MNHVLKSLKRKSYLLENTVLIALLLLVITIFIAQYPGDYPGILIICASYFIVITNKNFLKQKTVFFAVLISLSIHHIVAITNTYVGTTLGAGDDARIFQETASILARFGSINLFLNGSDFYNNFLAMFYKIFGVSHLLGEELSVFAFLMSTIILSKMLDKLNITQNKAHILFLYGMLPTCFLFTSITLRESWQMLFFMSIAYSAMKLRVKKSASSLFFLLICLFCLSFWHNGLLGAIPMFAFVSFYWAFGSNRKSFVKLSLRIVLALLLIVVSIIFMKHSPVSSTSSALFSGDAMEYTQQYRSTRKQDGASYGITLQSSSPIELLIKLPLLVVNYLFAPFPWQIRGILDLYAALESLLRFFLLWSAFYTWRKHKGEQKQIYGFLLLMALTMECLWSLGTNNWGTAMRHHLVTYGLLLALGGNRLILLFKRFIISIYKV